MKKYQFMILTIILVLITIHSASAYTTPTSCWSFDSDGTDYYSVNDVAIHGATNASGHIGNARDFDGSNDFANSSFSVATGAPAFSFTGWVYRTQNPSGTNYDALVNFFGTNQWEGHSFVWYQTYYASGLKEGVDSYSATPVGYAHTTSLDEWVHVAHVHDSGVHKIYVNGVNTYNLSKSLDFISTTNVLQIGRAYGGEHYYDGKIDELKYYDSAISNADIISDYNSGSGVACGGESAGSLTVSLSTPANDTRVNNITIPFVFNVTKTSAANCTLQLNNGSGWVDNETIVGVDTGLNTINVTNLSMGAYTWRVNCTDGTLNATSEEFLLDVDRIDPVWTYQDNHFINTSNTTVIRKGFDSLSQLINVTLSDTSIFAYDITLRFANGTVLVNQNATGLTSTVENISFSVDHSGITTNEEITATFIGSDDHTAEEIPEYPHTITQQYIEYRPPSGNTIRIESVEGNLAGLTTVKLLDRYTFALDWGNARNEHEVVLICDETLYYRGDLYMYPSFVCGEHWVDFVPVGLTMSDFEAVIVKPLADNSYSVNFKTVSKVSELEFSSIGGLNIVNESFTYNFKVIDVFDHVFSAVNSTGDVFGDETAFNTSNLVPIEKLQFNFSVKSEDTLNESFILWYTASGTSPCATGNINQSCNGYPTFVKFIDGEVTSTYDGTTGNQGDSITCSYSGNDTARNYTCLIDEHYNPNIFKWYDARYNFSDVKYQTGVNQQLRGNNQLKIEVDDSTIPLNADFYKLDFRVEVYSGADDEIEAYACNSSYTTGNPNTLAECELVAALDVTRFQDDGTKFRAVFTNDLVEQLGDIKYIILRTDEKTPNDFFALKTYRITNTNHSEKWAYSTNNGASWTNGSDGYESELNINWFYANHTAFNAKVQVWTDTLSFNSTLFNLTWDIDNTANLAPIVNIITPTEEETIRGIYSTTFSVAEPDSDNYTVAVYLNGSLLVNGSSLNNYSLNTNNYVDGDYTFLVVATDNNSLTDNDSHSITIGNTQVIDCITINRSNLVYTLQNNISSSSSCFSITAENTTLNCDDYTIRGTGSGTGIEIDSSVNVTVENCLITLFSKGIDVISSTSGTIRENNIKVHSQNNLHLEASTDNNIYNNFFGAATFQTIELISGSNNNYIYNNYFNTSGVGVDQAAGVSNYYNITLQTGSPIWGGQTLIGGNYWSSPSNNGYSDICNDTDYNGICDQPLDLATGSFSIDYLPLSFLPPNVLFNCIYTPTPRIGETQEWRCILNNVFNESFGCRGLTLSPDGSLLDVYPRLEMNEHGVISSIESTPDLANTQYARVRFSNKRVKVDTPTLFSAQCVGDKGTVRYFNRTLTVGAAEFDESAEFLLSTKDNVGFIVFGILAVFVILTLLVYGYQKVRS